MSVVSTSVLSRTVTVTSTENDYEWLTDWMRGVGVANLRVSVGNADADANFIGRFAIQTSPSTTEGAVAPLANTTDQVTGDGSDRFTHNLPAGTYWWRVGVANLLSGAPFEGSGTTSVQVSWEARGECLAAWGGTLRSSSTTQAFFPLTGWLSTVAVENLVAVGRVSGVAGGFRWRLAVKRAAAFSSSPETSSGAEVITALEGTPHTADEDPVNISLNGLGSGALSGFAWFRLGIAYELAAAGSGSGVFSLDVSASPV